MPRSPCTCNGMAYHWIAQALWHCMHSTGTHSHARAWHYEMLVIVKLSGSIGAVSSARSQ